ncbi:MAG: hypothetical protein NDI93_02045 [Pseudomonas sp.]|nr:hypothetical protein [Pseudomonas sp.]
MQRYHDVRHDPLPTRAPHLEAESQRLEQLTQQFLATGGQIKQVGHQMKDSYPFVVCLDRSPVYAHLFEQRPPAPKPVAKALVPAPAPVSAQAEPVVETDAEADRDEVRLAGCLLAEAALGRPPRVAALHAGVTEKQARQIARKFNIQFKTQR